MSAVIFFIAAIGARRGSVMSAVIFFIAALGAITGAIGVVSMRNPFYSVLMLIVHLVSLAALFLLLRAEFVAAAQVVVYAGAVMVLYLFVVAYVGGGEQRPSGPVLRVLGPLFALALAIELCIAMLGSALKGISSKGAPYKLGFGTPQQIGREFLTTYLFPFEIASILLLVAAVGAIVLARRRRGLEAAGRGHRAASHASPARCGPAPRPSPPASAGAPAARRTPWPCRPARTQARARAAGNGDRLVPGRLGHHLLHRRRRRADPTQSARAAALPRAHAQRGQPRPRRLRAHVGRHATGRSSP